MESIYYPDAKTKWLIVLIPGIFAALFLNLFQPFAIQNPNLDPIYMLALTWYGLQASTIIYVHEFILRRHMAVLNNKNTNGKTILAWYLWILLVISLGNFLYYSFFQRIYVDHLDYEVTGREFLKFVFRTFSITLIPVSGLILYFKYREALLRKDPPSSRGEVDQREILLFGENRADFFKIGSSCLLYIQSKNNYAQICYLGDDQQTRKYLLRTSLKELESQLKDTSILRCHQSFIVNKQLILESKGNSRKMKLVLKHSDIEIPVSRNRTGLFRP